MKKTIYLASLLCLAFYSATAQDSNGTTGISRESVRQYYKMVETLNSKLQGQDLFWQLEDKYGSKATYSAAEIALIMDPTALDIKTNRIYDPNPPARSTRVPFGAFTTNQVYQYFDALAAQDKGLGKQEVDRKQALQTKYGPQPWYLADEIRDVEKNGAKPQQDNVPTALKPRPTGGWQPFIEGLHAIKVRQDWSDLLNSEDLSQTDTGKKTLNDLTGANFSYAYDSKKNSSSWSAVGAVIVPATWRGSDSYGNLYPALFMVAPSVSINRVAGGSTANEVDHLDYRLGVYSKWLVADEGLSEIQVRGAFVYGTDTEHRASLPAGELEIEPKLFWRFNSFTGHGNWLGMGYGLQEKFHDVKLPNL